jgi:hypothetical protein
VVRNNWVHDNKSLGLWADTNDRNLLIEGNTIADVHAVRIPMATPCTRSKRPCVALCIPLLLLACSSGQGSGGGGGGGNGGGGSDGGDSSSPVTNTCAHPVFVTSDTNGGWDDGGYYVHNNMWNSSSYPVTETLYACSHDNWYVVANANDASGDGTVKTYPNVHKDYDNVPISSFSTLTSRFAASGPRVGIYNVAYDIWLNGVAESGCTELMIWTENYNQVPGGRKVATATLGGRTYDVWRDTWDWQYVAFVPTAVMTSGTVDIKEVLQWMIDEGWITSSASLGQVCFGVEIVSTDGTDATFTFRDFSIGG